MVVDSNSEAIAAAASKGTKAGAAASPFVIAIVSAGIKGLPSLINACILLFCLSAANSDQYIASRTLYGMAKDGNAPHIFTRCSRRGVPYFSFIFTACFMGLAFLVASDNALTVFNYFASAVTICGALSWISITASHIAMMRGMKAQGISRDTLPWKAPFQPYYAWTCLVFTCIIAFFKGESLRD
jgi:amino acid transporter